MVSFHPLYHNENKYSGYDQVLGKSHLGFVHISFNLKVKSVKTKALL